MESVEEGYWSYILRRGHKLSKTAKGKEKGKQKNPESCVHYLLSERNKLVEKTHKTAFILNI